MQEDMNMTRKQSKTPKGTAMQRPVRKNVEEELLRLRDDLYRIAKDIRMKSKGASAEIQHTRQMLEREVKRFGAEVQQAADRTQQDLLQLGGDLRMRYQKLANQIVFPPN